MQLRLLALANATNGNAEGQPGVVAAEEAQRRRCEAGDDADAGLGGWRRTSIQELKITLDADTRRWRAR